MTEPAAVTPTRPARPRRLRGLSIAIFLGIVALLAVAVSSASAAVNEFLELTGEIGAVHVERPAEEPN